MQIRIDSIRPSPFATRSTPLEVASLAESIKKFGQLQPIKVRPIAGGYECVFGNRRLMAMREAELAEIEAIVQDIDDRQARLQIWEENEEREDLDDVARGQFLRAYRDDYELSNRGLARLFGIDHAVVNALISLTSEPESIQRAVEKGLSSYFTVTRVRQIIGDDEESRVRIIDEAVNEGLGEADTIARARAIKYRQRTRGYGEPKMDEDWQQLPSVKQMLEQTKQLREWLRLWRAMVVEEKFAPEAKRFIAHRVQNLGKALLGWAEELEGVDNG